MQYHHRAANSPQGKKKRIYSTSDEEPASRHRAGHYAGLHPEDTPFLTTADVRQHMTPQQHPKPAYDEDELEANQRITSLARRYNGIPMPDGVLYRQGNEQIYVHHGPPPIQRASRNQTRARTTETVPVVQERKRAHWMVWLGLTLLVMLIGYVGLGAFSSWWQTHNDDSTYGRPRTFQVNAVVGHDDSQAHPSHFIAINLNRQVIVIEIPGGNVSKTIIYSGPVLLGNGQDLTPVTVTFADINGDGRLDMFLHILDQTIVFLNNGTKFVPPASLAINGGSNPPTQGEA